MRLSISLFVLSILTVGGCASLQSTPIQEYVWEMGHNCEHTNSSWQLDRVDAQGTYWIRGGNATSSANFQQCMQEQYRLHPYQQWLAANRKTPAPSTETKQPEPARRELAAKAPAPLAVSTATLPVWNPGDEWQYRWESPQGKGTFVWAVATREEMIDGVPFYVVKSGTTREIYYRKTDFAYYMETVNGQVETRHTPPRAFFTWPLVPGAKVNATYTRERPLDRQTDEMALTCETAGVEPVTVPAGTFDAVKLTCRNSRTNAVVSEMWLSPAVKHMVRERTQLPNGVRERELIGFKIR
jgi:hypothetical protein